MKEKLLTMPRKERKIYIRELQRKRKPNFDLALRCKILWEKLRRFFFFPARLFAILTSPGASPKHVQGEGIREKYRAGDTK